MFRRTVYIFFFLNYPSIEQWVLAIVINCNEDRYYQTNQDNRHYMHQHDWCLTNNLLSSRQTDIPDFLTSAYIFNLTFNIPSKCLFSDIVFLIITYLYYAQSHVNSLLWKELYCLKFSNVPVKKSTKAFDWYKNIKQNLRCKLALAQKELNPLTSKSKVQELVAFQISINTVWITPL